MPARNSWSVPQLVTAMLRGVTPSYFAAREWGVMAGREMTPEDNRRAANVVAARRRRCARSYSAKPTRSAPTIRIRDGPFTVVGLLERKGQSVWGDDQDDVVARAAETARRQFVGVSRANPRLVHNISVKFARRRLS